MESDTVVLNYNSLYFNVLKNIGNHVILKGRKLHISTVFFVHAVVQIFLSNFNFDFPLFQIMIMNIRQLKVETELV